MRQTHKLKYREATHSNSWYEGQEDVLREQIKKWIEQAQDAKPLSQLRAIIGPHAGYRFCGDVQAYCYGYIDPKQFKRVFLLGPSHHFYSSKCHISAADMFKTPLGDLRIDSEIRDKLMVSNEFEQLTQQQDEDEHSLELHAPYIKYIFRDQKILLVPIIVGAISQQSEQIYGKILKTYIEDPENLFIISSDFCHWGRRFKYQPYDQEKGEIYQYIDWLDHQGMDAIQSGMPNNYTKYMEETQNTICGQHPIAVLLNAIKNSSEKFKIEFKRYTQSSQCKSKSDSSVSYAAAIILKDQQT